MSISELNGVVRQQGAVMGSRIERAVAVVIALKKEIQRFLSLRV